MELAYLPQNKSIGKTYKHFTVNSYPVNAPGDAVKKAEFFYIGKNSQLIDSLVDLFEGGYAAESADKAIAILSKVVEKRNTCPGVIIVDATLGVAALQAIHRFQLVSLSLSIVPLMVEVSGISKEKVAELRRLSFIDDIIELQQCDTRLLTKINFLARIKDYKNQKELQQKINKPVHPFAAKYSPAKRVFDILVSSIALLMLSPLFILIAIAVTLESKGPVFYIAKRA